MNKALQDTSLRSLDQVLELRTLGQRSGAKCALRSQVLPHYAA